MNVLFLGAGKRLSLAEHFLRAAALEDVPLKLFSVEHYRHVAIASVATVFQGPGFREPTFPAYLRRLVDAQRIDIAIPLMDSATVILSAMVDELSCRCVVSDAEKCAMMEDKQLADAWFKSYDLPLPHSDRAYPCIYKPRHGYGSRGIVIVQDAAQESYGLRAKDYVRQAYVSGTEYTVDAYVDGNGRLISALSRQRVEVIGGEVTHSRTHRHEGILALTRRILAQPGWRGPITLQFMDTDKGPLLLEINPRFGGGAPHSIQLGLDAPRWILREALGRCVEPVDAWPDGSVMVRCLRDVYL